MKKIFLIAILLISSLIYAEPQRGGGMRGRSSQNNDRQPEAREIKEFSAAEAAGIFYYDVPKVLKKLKIKDVTIKTQVRRSLRTYNFKVKEIALLNKENFEDLNAIIKTARSANRSTSNYENNNQNNGPNVRQKVGEVIRPIRTKIITLEETLNESLIAVLSEKQNKKWIKYQEDIKEDMKPKRPNRNQNNNSQNQRRGGQRRGF
ncbi:hypothetical protein [Polaribacter dokdonensis]|uniref:Uncharacterized protein n=1 Tax=Polaribacter dokdonensis DSW-5 TaxID=1300348 RepID=A0A0M9CJ42_9FLAO|nr:hypothetical protein [Polaribacter dokdonensis]KOY53189.1 hypothetical protein I602_2749 [Polaribacter dokdonensis DSW-5]SEE58325.1 hypothetical protein SAMN05444353_2528 [Polaribacter dokdonensis DSW-5]